MSKSTKPVLSITAWVLLFCLIITSSKVWAQDYSVCWFSADAGGGTSSGGDYSMLVTIGQADAGKAAGGSYEFLGGFLPGGPTELIEASDYAKFAAHWMDNDCSQENNWCGGADLDHLNGVNADDLAMLSEIWLCEETVTWPLK